jgi:3-methyladenine DNA glycosylase Tag
VIHSFAPHPNREPVQITPRTLADYFEVLTRAVFNAGISWQAVESKWEGFGEAFAGFAPHAVAAFDDDDVERLVHDERIIRNRAKITGTVTNARTFCDLVDGHNGFAGWLHTHEGYDALEAALIQEFKFIGVFGAYWSLYTLGEDVPPYGDWCRSRGRTPPEGM